MSLLRNIEKHVQESNLRSAGMRKNVHASRNGMLL
jgi:hypothetical protein